MKQLSTIKRFFPALFLMFILPGMTLNAQQVTLNATDDAVVDESSPDAVWAGHASNLDVNGTTDAKVISYIKFDISNFSNRQIENAEFSTRGTGEMTVKLTKAGDDFTKDTTTWNTKPSTGDELADVILDDDSGRKTYENDGKKLVDYINSALLNGETEISFALQYKEGVEDGLNWIGGKNDGAYGPELIIEFGPDRALYAIDDAAAFQASPEQTAADEHAGNLFAEKIADNDEVVSFVKFELKGFAYKQIGGATFSTRGTAASEKTQTIRLRKSGDGFSRDTTNWNNKPSMSGELATKVYGSSSTRVEYTEIGNELVNYINSVLATGSETISFGLQYKEGDLDALGWIGGMNDGAYGPMLEIIPNNESSSAYGIADAVVDESAPDAVWDGNETNLSVDGTDGENVISFVKFDISNFKGRVLKTAEFSTRGSGSTTVMLTEAGDDFERSSTTWNSMPSTGDKLASKTYSGSDREAYTPDGDALVNYINEKLMSGATEISFALKYEAGDEAGISWIGGIGDGNYGPRLDLTFDYSSNMYSIADAVVDESTPDAVFDSEGSNNLFVEGTENEKLISFVKFDISSLSGLEINSAEFSTRGTGTMEVKLTEAGDSFERSTTTWDTKPSTGGKLAYKTYDDASTRRAYTPDGNKLVEYLQQKIAMGADEVSFALQYEAGDEAGINWIGGTGDGSYGPILEIGIKPALEEETVFVMEDAFVDEADPDANNGGEADMGIRNADDGTELETYLKFDLSEAPNAVIGAVKMTMYIAQHSSGTQRDDFFLDIYAVEDDSWAEGTITWNNKPSEGVKLIEENVTWYNSGQDVEWTSEALTHYLNAAIAEGKTSVSFVLKGKDVTNGDRLWMAGREWKPEATSLIFDYLTAPPAQEADAIADSYVSQVDGEGDSNFGGEADQHLINDDTNEASKWNFFKYDISNAYDEVVSATLNIYGSVHNTANISSLNFAIYGSGDVSWEEDAITWNNKPSVNNKVLLEGVLADGGRWFNLSSPAFTDYVNAAIENGDEYITLVAKATEETSGNRGWFSGKEWNGSSIILNYEPQVAIPTFTPAPGEYISSVDVEIKTSTANASIYYTTDGSAPDDQDGILYDGTPVTMTETTNLQAIAYAPELKESGIASGNYTLYPVSIPAFDPSPLVKYQENVTVSIIVQPEGSPVLYTTDGSDPVENGEPYTAPFLLTETTTVKAVAANQEDTYISPVSEAVYEVVATSADPGTGPGGVGYSDLSRASQPELGLWLRAHDLEGLSDGDKVTMWNDQSGNANDAWNDEQNVDSKITNTGENWNAAPTFIAGGPNNLPALRFGTERGDNGDLKNLVVNDADNLDGGSGLSIFMVVKRNQLVEDFAALIQKRDITAGSEQEAWVLEMDGGSNPNKMQFVVNKDLFIKSLEEFNADDYYLVNVNYNSNHESATFIVNGLTKNVAQYKKPVQATDAPVIIGGFQPMDVTEIAMYNSDLNAAQTMIVNHSLAAKYAVPVDNGLYTNNNYIYDIIGVGKAEDLSETESEEHLMSSGGGMVLSASAIDANGDFVMTGHNGTSIDDDNAAQSWGRVWYVQANGNATDVTMSFDFSTEGITSTPDGTYKLYHKSATEDAWTDMGITPSVDDDMLNFEVQAIGDGYYTIGTNEPGATAIEEISKDENREAFTIYPNPAADVIYVELADAYSGECMIQIFNNAGQVVMSEQVHKVAGALTQPLAIDGLKQGTYFVSVIQGGEKTSKAFIKK